MKRNVFPVTLLIAGFMNICTGSAAQVEIPAFPGAEGFGSFATGGRGGDVYIVTNLNDSGPGSFREAAEASGPRTIVFAVSGTIELQSRMRISNGDLTIAGQTAPGDGICFKNYSFTFSSDNIIARYITVRLGVDKRWENDAMNGSGDNIIVDHCSMSWGVDETASIYSVSNFTMQWCIISESLYDSFHSSGPHGMGGIWGGQSASYHHNLLAHHNSRLPRFCGSRYTDEPELEIIDHRNNVIYNWVVNSCYGAEGGYYNVVNNYYKAGPATLSSMEKRIIAPRADAGSDLQEAGVWGNFYVSGNYVAGYPDVTSDNWLGVEEVPEDMVDSVKSETPFDVVEITTQSPQDAYEAVLNHAGASLPKRDRVDARVTEETRTGTARYGVSRPGIINHPDNVGGYPLLESTTPPQDSDKDGMPDEWEDAKGLNKNDPEDGKIIQADGYSNLEHYLNELAGEFNYMLRPMEVTADVDDKTVNLSWTDLSVKEEGFVLEREDGENEYVEIDSLDADVESYTDNTIEEYGDYHYRLKAYNADMETCFTDGLLVEVKDPNPPQYVVTVDVEGTGNVMMNPDGGVYVAGTEVAILATPGAGWEFDGWTGDITDTVNPVIVIVDADKTITAKFINNTAVPGDIAWSDHINIFPVPFTSATNLEIELETGTMLNIALYDLSGRKLCLVTRKYYPSGKHRILIDGTQLKPGPYIVKINTDKSTGERLILCN